MVTLAPSSTPRVGDSAIEKIEVKLTHFLKFTTASTKHNESYASSIALTIGVFEKESDRSPFMRCAMTSCAICRRCGTGQVLLSRLSSYDVRSSIVVTRMYWSSVVHCSSATGLEGRCIEQRHLMATGAPIHRLWILAPKPTDWKSSHVCTVSNLAASLNAKLLSSFISTRPLGGAGAGRPLWLNNNSRKVELWNRNAPSGIECSDCDYPRATRGGRPPNGHCPNQRQTNVQFVGQEIIDATSQKRLRRLLWLSIYADVPSESAAMAGRVPTQTAPLIFFINGQVPDVTRHRPLPGSLHLKLPAAGHGHDNGINNFLILRPLSFNTFS